MCVTLLFSSSFNGAHSSQKNHGKEIKSTWPKKQSSESAQQVIFPAQIVMGIKTVHTHHSFLLRERKAFDDKLPFINLVVSLYSTV